MKDSRLVIVLKKFSTKEISSFREFVQSPFFNKHKDVIRLTDILANAAPAFSERKLQREKVFKKIWPRKEYDYMKLAHVMNYTMDLVEQFLALQEYIFEENKKNISLAKAFHAKDLDLLLDKELEKTGERISAGSLQNAATYFSQYEIAGLKDELFLKKQKRQAGDSIQQRSDALDRFYLSEKLRIYAEMKSRQNILNVEYQYHLRDELISHLNNSAELYREDPAINIYLKIFLLFSEDRGREYFQEVLQEIDENGSFFSRKEQGTFYDFAQNYCIKKINSGQPEYLREIFKIYQLLIKNELLPEENMIPAPLFKNITTVGLRLKELEWTENFIRNYHIYLHKDIRQDVYNYNLASIFYSRGSYGNALELLRDVEFTDVYYALGARSLLLKIYFEQDEDELLEYTIDAFNIYLKRNKLVSKYQYQVHFNLLKYVKKIHRLRSQEGFKKNAKSKLQVLFQEINNTKEITNKDWLLQQLDI